MKKLRIINPFRFIALVVIVALVIVLSIAFAQADREYITKTIYVESGDSLWSISQEHNNTDIPIREYIQIVCKLNNITPDIRPGQAIDFPVE